MTTDQILALARKHLADTPALESSARLALSDAVALKDAGDLRAASSRALASLRYSVGILSPVYRRCAKE